MGKAVNQRLLSRCQRKDWWQYLEKFYTENIEWVEQACQVLYKTDWLTLNAQKQWGVKRLALYEQFYYFTQKLKDETFN